MSKHILTFSLVITLSSALSGTAFAADPAKYFNNMDANNNGILTAREVEAASLKSFSKLDKNNNNSLQINEILTNDPDPRGKFNGMDVNNDGRVTSSEYIRKKVATFNILDRDNDGRINEQDYVVAYNAYMKKHYDQKK